MAHVDKGLRISCLCLSWQFYELYKRTTLHREYSENQERGGLEYLLTWSACKMASGNHSGHMSLRAITGQLVITTSRLLRKLTKAI